MIYQKRPTARYRIILPILLALITTSLIPLQAEAFTTSPFRTNQHKEITNSALSDLGFGFSARAAGIIKAANTHQDGWFFSWNYAVPEFHGDRYPPKSSRDAFNDLRNYIKEQKELAETILRQCNAEAALEAIGRALHGLQDFFSHSNFADELNHDEQEQAMAALSDTSIDPPANLKMTSWGVSDKDDPEHYTHSAHAKDAPGDPWFDTAKNFAVIQSHGFIEGIKNDLTTDEWNKLTGGGNPPPTRDTERSEPYNMIPGNTYQVRLFYASSWAVNLTILETLPNGVVFVDSSHAPNTIESVTLETPDNPPVTVVQWKFAGSEPLGSVEIDYTLRITEEAVSHPSVGLRCTKPAPSYILNYGEVCEVDSSGNQYDADMGGQQFGRIETTVGGIAVPVDKFGLLAPYIGLASTTLVAAVAAVVYVKRGKRRKEK